ncbi:hypothetical protein IPG36_04080 [bacterium]|nr:MAG: hypothetical protein IPG36_04080 [bacterium]
MPPTQAPPPSPLFQAMAPKKSGPPVTLIVAILFGLGTMVFGIMAALFYSQATEAKKTLISKVTDAVTAAKAEQKEADDAAYTLQAENPYRSYTAPVSFGSFEVKFPKSWASFVEEKSSGTQVNLQLNPEFVKTTNSAAEPNAARIILLEQTQNQFMGTIDSQVKNGKLKKSVTTVSGLPAFDVTGTFSDKKTIRQVIVPVRDKVILFNSENKNYASQFNEILTQSRIIP